MNVDKKCGDCRGRGWRGRKLGGMNEDGKKFSKHKRKVLTKKTFLNYNFK